MMATIMDCGDGSFIAGDPPTGLDLGQHWCPSCRGSGLSWDYDDGVCMDCWGRCVVDCDDTACLEHSALHPFDVTGLSDRQLDGWACVRCGDEVAPMVPIGWGARGRLFECAAHTAAVDLPMCPSTDHDGAQVPGVVRVFAPAGPLGAEADEARCEWCAEGLLSKLHKDGRTASSTRLR
jgi:hypothetical protein